MSRHDHLHQSPSRYATKLTLRDTKAKTIGEAQNEMTQLMKEKPHQFRAIDKVTTHEQVDQRGNYFSEVDGAYPRGMTTCEIVGISGDCGFSCPQLRDGLCESYEPFFNGEREPEELEFKDGEYQELKDLYI